MLTKPNPIGWFEIPVVDMARAKAFYEAIFECDLQLFEKDDESMAWFPTDKSAGSAGALVKHPDYEPSENGVVIYFTSPEIEEVLAKVPEAGGTVQMTKTSIGEYGFVAFILDTEGNKIGLHSRD